MVPNDEGRKIDYTGLKALVIDDQQSWRNRLQRWLSHKNAQVSLAGTINEAEENLEHEGYFDLVTVDMNLSLEGGEGWDLVQRFSETPSRPAILVISAANLTGIEVRNLLRNYGFTVDYVPKQHLDPKTFFEFADRVLISAMQPRSTLVLPLMSATESDEPEYPTDDLIGKQLGQYVILEKIGEGGMAAVFKAHQPSLARDVAIKVLSPMLVAQDLNFLKRFQQEARAIARLEHPHIIPIYDFSSHGRYGYIVMRYVAGRQTLQSIIDQPLEQVQALNLAAQIADALSYAHQHSIVHRDLKPSNVLLDQERGVLLSDFGLAKIRDASVKLSRTGEFMGTPAYMSPEQLRGAEIDDRTDIYALGIVLYQMLTGVIPHNSDIPWTVALTRNEELPALPGTINPSISETVEQVIMRSLAINPDDRFASAADLKLALQDAAEHS